MSSKTKMPSASVSKWALLGSTALTMGLLAPAVAQDNTPGEDLAVVNRTDDQPVDEIVVTGIRQALENAADLKRNADTVVDSIVASDVSSLPDLSVAEALQRVPGVTVSRFATGRANGGAAGSDFPAPEGSGNLVRGLTFVRSEFNGRDSFTANGGRALDFATIPPELIGAVDVYKNQSADLIEGGIGGTINLRTLEPFDRQGFTAVLTGDYTYTDLREEWAPQYSAIVGNRWDTDAGEFGLLVSFSDSELKSLVNGYQIGQTYPRRVGDGSIGIQGIQGNSVPDVPVSAFTGGVIPEEGDFVGLRPAFQLRTNEVDRDRSSYYGAAQYRNPDRTFEAIAKFARVENEFNSIERTVEWFPDANTFGGVSVSDVTLSPFAASDLPLCNGANAVPGDRACENTFGVDSGLFESGFVTDVQQSWFGAFGIELSNLGIGSRSESETDDYSLNIKFRPDDLWFINIDGQYVESESSSDQLWLGSNGFFTAFTEPDLRNPRLTFGVDPRLNIFGGNIDDARDADGNLLQPYVAPLSTSDPNGYHHQFAADQFQEGTGDLWSFRADVQRDFESDGWFESVRVGGRYVEREQTNSVNELNWQGIGPVWNGGLDRYVGYDTVEYDIVDFSDFYRGGVLQGENVGFLFASEENLSNPSEYFDFLVNEPDAQNAIFNPRTSGRYETDANGNLLLDDDGNVTRRFNLGETSDITEETFNAYIRTDFYRDLDNGMSIDGNVGVRYVRTSYDSAGFFAFQGVAPDEQEPVFQLDENGQQVLGEDGQPIRIRTDTAEDRDNLVDFAPEAAAFFGTVGAESEPLVNDFSDDYEFWLPSFNAKLNLNEDMLFRVGVSKAISRPNIQDLRAGQIAQARVTQIPTLITDPADPNFGLDVGAQDIQLSSIVVTGGNSELQPVEAWNYDATFEWYFGESNSFTAAVFYKDLTNVIEFGARPLEPVSLDGTLNPNGTITLDDRDVSLTYQGLINVAEVEVFGSEVAFQYFFDELPGLFGNLGVQANYTYIDAEATPPTPSSEVNPDNPDFETDFRYGIDRLNGQSDHTANVVGIYQDEKFEMRLAYNWRSEYLVNFREFITGNPVFIDDVGFLDASVKYDLTENLQLRFLGANLLDTHNDAFVQGNQDGIRLPRSSFINDRRFQFGVKLEF